MKKNIRRLLGIMITSLALSTTIFASQKQEASFNKNELVLDGRFIELNSFNIKGSNYISLRDVAQSLSGTSNQFDVSWNVGLNAIELIDEKAYTRPEDSFQRWYGRGSKYQGALINSKIILGGKEHSISAFNIDDSNYFKLRDLSEIIGFELDWDSGKNQMSILTIIPEGAYRLEKLSDNTSEKEITNIWDKIFNDESKNLIPARPSRWASTISSYMTKNENGTISIVEAGKEADKLVKILTYDQEHNLVNQKNISYELPIFGAFYSGEKYNYMAFGEDNKEEDNQKEVIRIVRYDKEFQKIDSASVKGGESFTISPFVSAAGRMAEYGDELVFHTSRRRYKTEDGLNHQSQLTIRIDTSTMKVTNDLGRFQENHVSHSFDQYVLFDNNDRVLLDHGDAYPRSIVLSKANGSKYDKVNLFNIPGEIGANSTGVSIGGFEASDTNYIAAMNTIDHSKVTKYTSFEMLGLEKDQRDIIISTIPKNSLNCSSAKQITLKRYVDTDKKSSIPYLVKISNNKFMALWQEYDSNYGIGDLNYVFIDGQGNPTSKVENKKGFKLSDCRPILVGDKVVWYSKDGEFRTYYTLGVRPQTTLELF